MPSSTPAFREAARAAAASAAASAGFFFARGFSFSRRQSASATVSPSASGRSGRRRSFAASRRETRAPGTKHTVASSKSPSSESVSASESFAPRRRVSGRAPDTASSERLPRPAAASGVGSVSGATASATSRRLRPKRPRPSVARDAGAPAREKRRRRRRDGASVCAARFDAQRVGERGSQNVRQDARGNFLHGKSSSAFRSAFRSAVCVTVVRVTVVDASNTPHEDSVGVGAEESRASRRGARERFRRRRRLANGSANVAVSRTAPRHDQPRVQVGDDGHARPETREARGERVDGGERFVPGESRVDGVARRAAKRLGEGARRERRRERLRRRAPNRGGGGIVGGGRVVVSDTRRGRNVTHGLDRLDGLDGLDGLAFRHDAATIATGLGFHPEEALFRGVRERGDARQATRLARDRGVRESEPRARASAGARGARARQEPRRRAPRVEQSARRRQDPAPIGREHVQTTVRRGNRNVFRDDRDDRHVQRGRRRPDLVRAERATSRVRRRDAQRLGGVARPEGVARAEQAQGRCGLRQPGGISCRSGASDGGARAKSRAGGSVADALATGTNAAAAIASSSAREKSPSATAAATALSDASTAASGSRSQSCGHRRSAAAPPPRAGAAPSASRCARVSPAETLERTRARSARTPAARSSGAWWAWP